MEGKINEVNPETASQEGKKETRIIRATLPGRKSGIRRRVRRRNFLLVVSGLIAMLLAACGDNTATVAPATTSGATSAATSQTTTTAAATSKASATAAPTTKASATMVATTAASSGEKIVIPEDGSLTGQLAILQKIMDATNKFKSVRIEFTSDSDIIPSGKIVIIRPDKASLEMTTGGEKQFVVMVGADAYESQDGKTWTKTDSESLGLNITDVTQDAMKSIKEVGGSTFSILPDEKIDGQTVGVIQIDTSTSSTQEAQDMGNGKLLYKFDKQTLRLKQMIVQASTYTVDTRYYDYDSSNNKVAAPQM